MDRIDIIIFELGFIAATVFLWAVWPKKTPEHGGLYLNDPHPKLIESINAIIDNLNETKVKPTPKHRHYKPEVK